MSDATAKQHDQSVLERRAPSWLVTGGVRAWLTLGMVGVVVVASLSINAMASIVIPLVIACVIGLLFAPVVQWMTDRKVPGVVATTVVILGLALIAAATVAITINGVVEQVPEIRQQVDDGVESLSTALADRGIDIGSGSTAADEAEQAGTKVLEGAAGAVGGIFSSLSSLFFGMFVLVFLLYYVLGDWAGFANWLGGHVGVPKDLGMDVVNDATKSIRLYFGALTISSIVVAIVIGMTMWAMGIPLAFTVAVVTFVTAYIPYLGAIISGAFAFIVALGAEGLTTALIVLAVVLVAQNVIQTVIQARISSTSLKVHPAVTFGSTISGAIIAGALGAILAPPLVASTIRSWRVVANHFSDSPDHVDETP